MEFLKYRRLIHLRVCSSKKSTLEEIRFAQGALAELDQVIMLPDLAKSGKEQMDKINQQQETALKK